MSTKALLTCDYLFIYRFSTSKVLNRFMPDKDSVNHIEYETLNYLQLICSPVESILRCAALVTAISVKHL